MTERKKLILNTIIKEHIQSGAPVGSGVLVSKYKLNISPATVRNEMAELEEMDYIIQPHTSAGRIPTEKAYELYLENFKNKQNQFEGKKISQKEKYFLDQALIDLEDLNIKRTAKELSRLSNNAVFWAIHKHNLFYTGISRLFQQPEFADNNIVYNISGIIDKMDDIIIGIFDNLQEGLQVFVGSKNHFSPLCGVIISKYKIGKKVALFGILGPLRMDYEKNISLVLYINQKLIN